MPSFKILGASWATYRAVSAKLGRAPSARPSLAELRAVVDESLRAFAAVGAPSTWVLSNHDVIRHASRLALTAENPQSHGIGPRSVGKPIADLGLRRLRVLGTPRRQVGLAGFGLDIVEYVALPPR